MVTGTCLCGQATLSFNEPASVLLCHCHDCRKISGGLYSYNVAVKDEDVKTTGNLKTFSKKADSGETITNSFCPECGTTLFRVTKTYDGLHIVKSGILTDTDFINTHVPKLEIYSTNRIDWVPAVPNAAQN